ncbi:ATP-binding protein [Sphingomonas sp.]|jgi:molecular chaperone HtpG|uniref:ATP-binding protein n=1 Tax=Sphingomonas sp. TaxID=28214 RepID=UPI002ED99D7A
MSTALRKTTRPPAGVAPELEKIVIGKDILELVSSSMYVDPMTVYREYVQNAADAVDLARTDGLIPADEPGVVAIAFETPSRTVRIRDNGAGVPWDRFVRTLTGLGGSAKRGTQARGFRGVGRLAGLGYAQELVFRSRVAGEGEVSELRWDCRRLKALLRSTEFSGGVADLIAQVVTVARIPADDEPERFFEVELRGIVRLRSDRLMTPAAVAEYLSQVAPVPFSPDFSFGTEISSAMRAAMQPANLHIHVNGTETPLYRPHRDTFDAGGGRMLAYEGVEIRQVPDMDGAPAALAWVLHHPYEGAIPVANLVKGLRLRSGDVQVGGGAVLEELFAEQRFNAWSVGEVHVLDRRIVPNGRRDDFEQNAHLNNLINQLAPLAREISRRCRSNSIRRNWVRRFQLGEAAVQETIDALAQGSIGAAERDTVARMASTTLAELDRIAAMPLLDGEEREALTSAAATLRSALEANAAPRTFDDSPFAMLPRAERTSYERMFELIYECSVNRVAARKLIDRITAKVTAAH